MIRAAIFDMDGLLVDSEPLWREAEKAVFGAVGVELDDAMCGETVGLRVDAIVRHWHDRFAWRGPSVAEVADLLRNAVASLASARTRAKPGAVELVDWFCDRGLPVAICSSSPRIVIDATLRRLGIARRLAAICSAEALEHGKPHPAPYLATAAALGVEPGRCLAFEDSLNGALSAKAAGMTVVAVPEPERRNDPELQFCDVVLAGLAQFDEALFESLANGSGDQKAPEIRGFPGP